MSKADTQVLSICIECITEASVYIYPKRVAHLWCTRNGPPRSFIPFRIRHPIQTWSPRRLPPPFIHSSSHFFPFQTLPYPHILRHPNRHAIASYTRRIFALILFRSSISRFFQGNFIQAGDNTYSTILQYNITISQTSAPYIVISLSSLLLLLD